MIYTAPEKLSIRKLGAQLSDELKINIEADDNVSRIYFDTFDWRLFKSGMVLEAEIHGALCLLTWRELGSGRIFNRRTHRKLPKTAADFSDAGMLPNLKQILGRRTLLAHVSLNGTVQRLLLLNEDDKTLMRIELRRDHVVSPINHNQLSLEPTLYVFPYRGYEKIFSDGMRRLAEDERFSPIATDPLNSALNAIGVIPGEYSSSPDFSLDARQPAMRALVEILQRFLQIIESNVKGAREDEDPEYLHDFLAAVRRTRSFIHQFAAVFPSKSLKFIEEDFNWIEQEATPIRDLDIYMNLFDDFESRVDRDHRQALQSLYLFLQNQKQQELRRMRISLESTRYFRLIESWAHFLAECKDANSLSAAARAPIGVMARDSIWNIYGELLQTATNISSEARADELCELHQLSKLLEYHMDVFKSLFPAKRMARLLAEHDGLQCCLNQFRDLNLQYSRLKRYKAKMGRAQAVRAISMEAVEQLILDREQEKQKARKQVVAQIKRFTKKKMRKRFKSILTASIEGCDE
jgi:CHAD domain-containing protein